MQNLTRPSLAAALVLATVAAAPVARAQTGPPPSAVAAASLSLEQRLNALETQVAAVQCENAALRDENAALQGQMAALQRRLAASKDVLDLEPYVRVDLAVENGVRAPNIVFSGANVHIVSGSGKTRDNGNALGLGNLILGYDEEPLNGAVPRNGSHNLVIGRYHQFTQAAFGGLIAGEQNTVSYAAASVPGGFYNTASAYGASVTGGYNTASGSGASVTGGYRNAAVGGYSVVIGGKEVINYLNITIAPQPPFPN